LPSDLLPESLPHADEAERSVLAAVLLDNEQFHRAQEVLTHEAFYSSRHQRIFQALERLAEKQRAFDLVTLKDELAVAGDLEKCGGASYLAALLDGVPRSGNVEHYAKIVREKAILRALLQAATEIQAAALSGERGVEQILDDAEKAVFRVAEDRLRAGFQPIRVVAERGLRAIEELTKKSELVTGVATGFLELDGMTAGLQPSDLIILAARPSMGKTTLALNFAAHAALRTARTVGIFSLEMSSEQLFQRLLCAEARVDSHRVRTGRVGREEWNRIGQVYSHLVESHVFVDDSPGIGILEMRAKARRLQAEAGLDLLLIDYLQLMRGRERRDSRQQEISDISRSLKELAKELKIPVVALSQLSRAPEQRGDSGRRPQLSDLRESGAIEQDADVVLFLYREEVYKKDDPDLHGKAELIVGKQRNGPTGTVPLVFLKEFTRFENDAGRFAA